MNYQVKKGKNEEIINLFKEVEHNVYSGDENRILDDYTAISEYVRSYNDDIELFVIVDQNGKAISRCGVNVDLTATDGGVHAMFAFFESMNDTEAVKLLFKEIENWCLEKNIYHLIGPMTDNITFNRGILLDEFTKPVFSMPYNKSYYKDLFEAVGLDYAKKMLEFIIDIDPPYTKLDKLVKFIKKKNPDILLREIDLNNLEYEIKEIAKLYNKAWINNWGYREMKWEDFYNAAIPMKDIMKYSSVVTLNGKFIAFQVIVPDLNQIYKDGSYDFSRFGEIDEYRGLFIGVDPEYRMIGIEALMYERILNDICPKEKIKKFHVGWVQEDNYKMKQQLKNLGREENINYKTYALYEKEL